jgi:phosphotransferase system HPr (HPr) family protein
MDQPRATRTVTVLNHTGLHLRAALAIFQLARQFQTQVEIVMDRQRAAVTEILNITALGARPGQELVLEASGPQAEQALDALVELFAARFHEDDAQVDDAQGGKRS